MLDDSQGGRSVSAARMEKQHGGDAHRRWLMLVLALAAVVLGTGSSISSAATPACVVKDVGTKQSYGTLQEAVNAATEGDTLKVKGTCDGDTTITKSLTIAGQGHAILDGENDEEHRGSVVYVAAYELLPGSDYETSYHDVIVAITGLTITGGNGGPAAETIATDDGTRFGGGLLNDGGSVTLTNSKVSGNALSGSGAKLGGGIFTYGYSGLKLIKTTVSGNTAPQGGGIAGTFGDATLTSSTVSGNTGGGIYGGQGGDWALTGSTVSDNHGSGITVVEGSVTLTDSKVSDNTTGGSGGGIGGAEASVRLTGSTVSDNTAGGEGGGITLNFGTTTLTNSTVSGNTATRGGGLASGADLILNGASSVSRNMASEQGGGIYQDGGWSLTMNGSSTVSRNTSAGTGGGIYNGEGFDGSGPVTLNESASVSRNSSQGDGGGIFNERSAHGWEAPGTLITLNGSSSVSQNTSSASGGGIYNQGESGEYERREGSLIMNEASSVSGNKAAEDGGGIFNSGTATLKGSSSVTKNKAGLLGGGIFNDDAEGATLSFSEWTGAVSDNKPDDVYEGGA
jgi:hypothetical protein